MRLALVASHRGPYEALKPVARAWRGGVSWVLDGTAAAAARAEGLAFSRPPRRWEAWFRRRKISAVLRGTSELPERSNVEAAAARADARGGLPVFALEDFPGNYLGPAAGLTGLFVEFSSLKVHHAKRGLPAARVHAFGNPRYARLPRPALTRAAARRRLRLGSGYAVLWAGQPDGGYCRRTLLALAPALRELGATLLFRAHPRDETWAGGGYLRPLQGLRVIDLTAELDPRAALAAADLVVTQFSSMAIEAAAGGVPALFALLPGAGARYLESRGGLTSLPWCESGAAFLLSRKKDAPAILARALGDLPARRAVVRAMKAHFGRCRGSAEKVVELIVQSLNELKSHP